MNRKTILALAVSACFGAATPMVFAQGVQQTEAIASSDVLSQISMFSYKEGPKSDLLFRGTPIAATLPSTATTTAPTKSGFRLEGEWLKERNSGPEDLSTPPSGDSGSTVVPSPAST